MPSRRLPPRFARRSAASPASPSPGPASPAGPDLPRSTPRSAPPALLDEPVRTALSHTEHFLLRVLRCQGADLDRAMRLYHHSDVVRRMVPELMENLLPGHERAAIPLRPGELTPHVVVTRTGVFVTCLGADMSLCDLPILPYGPLDHEIRLAELESGRALRVASIYQRLPPVKIMDCVTEGPFALTREMVTVIDQDPWAYDYFIYQQFLLECELIHQLGRTRNRVGYRRRLEVELTRMVIRLRQYAHLIGALDGDLTEHLELQLVNAYTPAISDLALAIARKPGRGRVLLRGMEPRETQPDLVRAAAFDGLMMHCLWYPEEALWIVPRLRELPLPDKPTWFGTWSVEIGGDFTAAQSVEWFQGLVTRGQKQRQDLDLLRLPATQSPRWSISLRDHVTAAQLRLPVSHLFPPAELAAEVRRGYAEHLRQIPEKAPSRKPTQPIARAAPRPERNAPCPCGSGLKHKRCCALAPGARSQGPLLAAPAP